MQIIKKILLNISVIFRILFYGIFNKGNEFSITGIVFSMDRPIQLFALLESYYLYCGDPAPLYVLYKATNNDFNDGYNEIVQRYKDKEIIFVKETSFRTNLISLLKSIQSEYMFFLVDDNIFKSHFSFSDYFQLPNYSDYILSLRLGENLNYCYTRALKQDLPDFTKVGKFYSWNMNKGFADWKYAFSVDGHLYNTNEILGMSKLLSFKAPNSYEANMNVFRFILRRKKGLCYQKSVLINVCLNRVQDEISNISGDISIQELQKYWNDKKKIDIAYFHNIDNKSAHIEINQLPLTSRK